MRDRAAWLTWAARVGAMLADPSPRPNKYHAQRVQMDGRVFASVKEANRYQALRQLERAGAIAALECQPVFPLHVMELYRTIPPIQTRIIGRFTADFQYLDRANGEIVVEDVKSEATKTEAYRLRKRLAEAIHGIYVREL
jgi:hypothetical protein